MATWQTRKPVKILDFDIENRPLSYLGGDFTTPEITAIGYQFIGDKVPIQAWVLGHECSSCGHNDGDKLEDMLRGFRRSWDEADLVTGHNVIQHDLKHVNAMLLEAGMSPLHPKMVCDTWADLKKRAAGFASQATLASMLGVKAPKVSMSTPAWREANRLTVPGMEKTYKRVVGDVRQHIQVRKELLKRGWLKPPQMWQP